MRVYLNEIVSTADREVLEKAGLLLASPLTNNI